MFDLQRIYHTGLAVSDLEAAMEMYTRTLHLAWSPIRVFDPLPFWTPAEGAHEVTVRAAYSRQGPHHVELCWGTNSFYDPHRVPDTRHIGVWTDDLPGEAEAMLREGWVVDGAIHSPDDGYGPVAYLRAPAGALLVELVSTELKPSIDEWING